MNRHSPFIAALIMSLSSGIAGAEIQAPADHYIGKPDCRVFNPRPVADESITWSGPCKNGFADGNGILLWYINGKEDSRYEGGMQRGRKHGPSAQQDANGTITWGNYVEGKRHGETRIERENAFTLDATFERGTITGPVTAKYVSGNKYVGGWGPHGPEGDGTMEYATGGSFTGFWKDGQWHSHGMLTYSNGVRREPQSAIAVTEDKPKEARRDHKLARDMNSLYRMQPLAHGATVPFNKGYKDLSAADQRTVRSWFPVLRDDDVPPYPVKGNADIVKAIAAAHGKYGDNGALWMDVLIDEQGVPKEVMVRRSPGKEVSEFAASVLLVSKYTPAQCGGAPCAMRFPIRLDLRPAQF